ncbi:LegC family aminotransferase [Pseudomaricurvus alcaniphilus]|uniref:LegC family aminotransferase n=1 Tax=Pseudomaricurvus alcaniphilus TaxID=1166482 RepID=UPI0014083A00|nr:LegC family aminotransferase [Pseudomaricurvus alcaniphilus]NHN39443.1 LegC family aminotransferase [Pseudomaricurvus alcaniphilus]
MFDDLFEFIQRQYPAEAPVALHRPLLGELEKQYLAECIDSTFVSSVGPDIAEFEQGICELTDHRYAIATVNGTAALQLGLTLSGVDAGSEVIIQPFTFVATANAIRYCGANPVFVDIESRNLGICPQKLRQWLLDNVEVQQGVCVNKTSNRRVVACLCMHTFGHPSRMDELLAVCQEFGVLLLEDGAEALGSRYRGEHVGHHGDWMAISFNGNKIITTGGGGALLSNDESWAQRAKHLGSTAKTPHPWETSHDQLGFNFRLPNINAALGRAQLQRFQAILADKRQLARQYQQCLQGSGLEFVLEPDACESNYWLNAVLCRDQKQRDHLLQLGGEQQLQLRPAWTLLHRLPMYRDCLRGDLATAEAMAMRLVNLPSSARAGVLDA